MRRITALHPIVRVSSSLLIWVPATFFTAGQSPRAGFDPAVATIAVAIIGSITTIVVTIVPIILNRRGLKAEVRELRDEIQDLKSQ